MLMIRFLISDLVCSALQRSYATCHSIYAVCFLRLDALDLVVAPFVQLGAFDLILINLLHLHLYLRLHHHPHMYSMYIIRSTGRPLVAPRGARSLVLTGSMPTLGHDAILGIRLL